MGNKEERNVRWMGVNERERWKMESGLDVYGVVELVPGNAIVFSAIRPRKGRAHNKNRVAEAKETLFLAEIDASTLES